MKTIQQQKARQQQSALWKVFFVVRVGVSGGGEGRTSFTVKLLTGFYSNK